MFNKVFKRFLFSLLFILGVQFTFAQGYQIIYDTGSRDLYHNCSSSTADGGFYVVSQFSVRNLPAGEDSIGIHITKCDMKGELQWGKEYFVNDVRYEKYLKGIECKVLGGDTLAIVATDIEASETSDAKIFFQIEPMQGSITFQTLLVDKDEMTEDVRPGIHNEILVDHNQEVYYFGSHNSADTIGVHMEKFGPQNISLASRTYIAMDSDTTPISMSLYDAQTLRDTGFVFTARLGEDEDIEGALVKLDSLGNPLFASRYSIDDGMSVLDPIGVTATADSCYVQLGILSSLATGTETSVIIKTDSIGRVLWSKTISIPSGRSQAQEIDYTFSNEIVIAGKYADFGTEQGDYVLFIDNDGNILRQVKYTDENSVWDDNMNAGFQFDALDLTNGQDGMLLISSQAQRLGLNYAPTVIKADQMGMTLCSDTVTLATLIDVEIERDTLMLTESAFVQRDSVVLKEIVFGSYDLPTGNLETIMFCPNQVPIDTFFDATLNSIDSSLVSYLWETGDTTPIINYTITQMDADDGMAEFPVVITVLDQVCYTICDTARIMAIPAPEGIISANYLCDTREWQLTIINTTGEIVSNEWVDDMGNVTSTEITIIVPDTPGQIYASQFVDICGIEVLVTWEAPPLPAATIGVDNSNVCPVPGFIVLSANMTPLYPPLQYSWSALGAMVSTNPTIQVTEADLSGGPVQYTVTVTDDCGNTSENSVIIDPSDFEIPVSTLSIGGSLTINPGCPLELSAIFQDGLTGSTTAQSYSWSTGENTSTILVTEPGDYTVTVLDLCDRELIAMITVSEGDLDTPAPNVQVNNIGLNPCEYFLEGIGIPGTDGTTTFAIDSSGWNGPGGFVSSDNVIVITEPGTYTYEVRDICDKTASGFFNVTAEDLALPQPVVNISVSTDENCNVVLTADGSNFSGNASYSWSNNVTGPVNVISDPGDYTVTLVDECGQTATATANVTAENFNLPQPVVDISVSDLDPNCNLVLTANGSNFSGNASYNWSNTVTGPVIGVGQPGEYTVTLVDDCGQIGTATVNLTAADFQDPEVPTVMIEVQNDTISDCGKTLIAIPGNVNQLEGFVWSTGETGSSIMVEEGGTYTVTLTANCGQVATSEAFDLSLTELEFPNIFFPESINNEGINSSFGPETTCPDFTNYKLEVYNRWGKRVFEADNVESRWSGTLNSQGASFLEEDVYMWQCSYTDAVGDQSQKGSVTLVRR